MTKVLVIEDELAIRENIVELLEVEDFDAMGAPNGRVGLELAQEHLPDLILCDVMMPELDGYGVLKGLRSDPITATIPFIFLTAKADKGDLREGMSLGADDYLTKPCTPEELLDAINTRLEKHEQLHKQAQKSLEELRQNISRSLPHELRTPLNGILGFSDLILMDYDSLEREELLEMVEHIRTSGHRLYRVIVNFLMYAELEILATNESQVKEMRKLRVNSVISLLTEQAETNAKTVNRTEDLTLDLQDSSVSMNGDRLKKLVDELLDNAFKFSKVGSPVSVKSQVENDKFILSVKDLGRGMTSEQITEVGAYMQFERKLYEQQGMGLGLAITKQLVDLYGGQLHIESEQNQYTIVQVSLPI